MVRKNRQKRKAKIKNTPTSSEKNDKKDDDELMYESDQTNDNGKPTVNVECEENTAETSRFSTENAKYPCAVSIKKTNA